MATGHGLAVLTNSLVKVPVNPETGLSSTLNERILDSENGGHSTDVDGMWEDTVGQVKQFEDNYGSSGSSQLFNSQGGDKMTTDLSNLTQSEFYQQLLALKDEHQKTLQMCEDLYNTKLELSMPQKQNGRQSRSKTRPGQSIKKPTPSKDVVHNNYVGSRSPTDKLTDLSTSYSNRPPIAPRRSTSPIRKTGRPGATSKKVRIETHASESAYFRPPSDSEEFSGSDDEAQVQDEMFKVLKKSQEEEDILRENDTRHNALSKIDDMWDQFSIDEYAPRTKPRPRSASLSTMRSTAASTKKAKEDANAGIKEWKHRVTIPKPFSMTMREESLGKTKSRTLEEFEEEKKRKELEEAAECQRSIKATPVPAHVYMPLYDQMVETVERKRNYSRQKGAQLLKSKERPFNFMKRDEEQKKLRNTEMEKYLQEEINEKKQKKPFKAKPFPRKIFDKSIDDRILEEEEYRRIRVQMRAEELMATSSLPNNMKQRGEDYVKARSRQKDYARKAKKSGIPKDPDFKPKVNEGVPDFDQLHRKMQSELWKHKDSKEATVCKPFNLKSSRSSEQRRKLAQKLEEEELAMRDRKFRTLSRKNSSLSSSMDSIPTKMTATVQYRNSANRARIQKEMAKELDELEAERKRRTKARAMSKLVAERATANDLRPILKAQSQDKMRAFRESEKARAEEYRRQMNEMKERLDDRPLLFERTSQTNARRAAEKRYQETLREAGLDEDYISRVAAEAVDEGSGDEFDDPSSHRSNYSHRSLSSHHSGPSIHSSHHSSTRSKTYSSTKQTSNKKYTDDFNDEVSEDDFTQKDASDLDED